MPVEIRELVIRTTLESRPPGGAAPSLAPVSAEALRREILDQFERLIGDYQTSRRFER